MSDRDHANGIGYHEMANIIADTIAKGSKKLTEDQGLLLAGALAVVVDKAIEDFKGSQRVCRVCLGSGKHLAHNWKNGTKEERECYGCTIPNKRWVRK